MSSLQPIRPSLPSPRISRGLARISDRTDVEIAATLALAEVEAARVDGLHAVTRKALESVALVSQLEQQLSQLVPLSTSRLQAIGDIHALTSAQIVSDAGQRQR